jgi:hypothetical protein
MSFKTIAISLSLVMLFSFGFACKKTDPAKMETLQQNLQSKDPPTQGPSKPQVSPPAATPPTEDDKLSEEEIQSLIKSKVDGFQVKGLSKIDLSPIVLAKTEFIEISSIQFFNNDKVCEVSFAYYLIPEELKNKDSIESDGMIFNVSKQYQQGLAIFQYEATGWKLITLVNEFRQLNFLVDTERR